MDRHLQEKLFEANLTATVEITELYGPEPGGVFDFVGEDWKEATVETCLGDLIVMVNALEDYANILNTAVEQWNLQGVRKAMYDYHAARCRKISRHYANTIGYNYEQALIDCKKKRSKKGDDIGEDALVLAVKKGRPKVLKELDEPKPEQGGLFDG